MEKQRYHVLGIGNAIVDIISLADDKVLDLLGLVKGSMMLVDEQKTEFLYNYISCIKEDFLTPPMEMSGGCAANTVAAITSFGGTAAFIGKVSTDYFGNRFTGKLRARGVHFTTQTTPGAPGTARSLIIVTQDDAARTMCTFLGGAMKLSESDIEEDLVAGADVTFIEGYLLDCAHGSAAIRKAIHIAHKHGKKVGFTLSDSLCVKRHYDEMIDLVDNHIDILFANKREINALYCTTSHEDSIRNAAEKCRERRSIAALTCGSDGAVVIDHEGITKVPASRPDAIIDTTGCGDLFVAGFLYGHLHGYNIMQSTRLGNMAAVEIIKQLGARPKMDLSDLLDKPEVRSTEGCSYEPHPNVKGFKHRA